MTESFPFEGQRHPAAEKKAAGTVFFVHFFGGDKRRLRRHVRLVNALGYDAFTFNLRTPTVLEALSRPPLALDGRFGIKHLYADQIGMLLNRIAGPKLIYAFSNPSAAAIEAIVRRNFSDVTGLIVDSGPSARFVRSVYNLYSRGEYAKTPPVRWIATPLFSLLWSPRRHADLREQLDRFPAGFPVLSIRGWKDPLIPPGDIDLVFDGHPQLDLRKLDLPGAGHLNGLRDFRDEYVPPVARFLEEHLR